MMRRKSRTGRAKILTGELELPNSHRTMDVYQLRIDRNLLLNFSYLDNQTYDIEDLAEVFLAELHDKDIVRGEYQFINGKLVDLSSGKIIDVNKLDLLSKQNPLRVIIERSYLTDIVRSLPQIFGGTPLLPYGRIG